MNSFANNGFPRSIACPRCGHRSFGGFVSHRFACTACGAHLRSNLRLVGFVEWLIGAPIFFLVAAMLQRLPWFLGWPYGGLAVVLFLPACIVHVLVLRKFLEIRQVDSEEDSEQVTKNRS